MHLTELDPVVAVEFLTLLDEPQAATSTSVNTDLAEPILKESTKAQAVSTSAIESKGSPAASLKQLAAGTPIHSVVPMFYLTRISRLPARYNSHTLSLSQLVQGSIKRAILCNYMVDLDWVLHVCPVLLEVPVVDVVHGDKGDRKAAIQRVANSVPRKNIRTHSPPLPIPYGTHHTKMLILCYDLGVRVVVCTANFIAIDWGLKSQAVWFQDFPLKPSSISTATSAAPAAAGASTVKSVAPSSAVGSSDFEADLLDYLHRYQPMDVSELRRYDYSSARAVLVPSVPGYHTGINLHRYGHMKMRALLGKQHFAGKFASAPVIAQCSSLGSLPEHWLDSELATSLSAAAGYDHVSADQLGTSAVVSPGASPVKAGAQLKLTGFKRKGVAVDHASQPSVPLYIVWPTVEDVRTSLEGYSAGGSIPFNAANNKPFLKQRFFHKWRADVSGRQRCMPHIKTYARADPNPSSNEIAWALITSANVSQAAWGALQKGGSRT